MAGSSQSRLLLNLVLLLVVAGLGGLVWWQASQPEQQAETLLTQTRADITRITISRKSADGKPDLVRLERTGEQWNMLEPKQMQANSTRMTQLFTLLDETVDASYDATGMNLAQYGLEPAAVSLAFNDQTLLFGEENPVSHKRYILTEGRIKLASEAVYGLLSGDPLALVSNKLVPEGRTVRELSLPEGFTGKSETLRNWQSADAVRMETLEEKADSQQHVTLILDDGSKLVFALLPEQGELVLVNEAHGIRYILPEPQRINLLPPAE